MNTDNWEIIPYIGVGPLRFGMNRSQARSLIEVPLSTFKRGPFATNDTDAYDDYQLHLDYDPTDRLMCIMAFGECVPIHYKDVVFLGRNIQSVVAEIASHGFSVQYDDEGHWVLGAGFVLYAPDDVVKAVTVFKKGYYEEEIARALTSRKD